MRTGPAYQARRSQRRLQIGVGNASSMNDNASPADLRIDVSRRHRRDIAVAVFIVDTVTPLDIAVAVLYVVVVLLAANYFQRRGVLLVSMGCLTLTVLSFLLTHGFVADNSLLPDVS